MADSGEAQGAKDETLSKAYNETKKKAAANDQALADAYAVEVAEALEHCLMLGCSTLTSVVVAAVVKVFLPYEPGPGEAAAVYPLEMRAEAAMQLGGVVRKMGRSAAGVATSTREKTLEGLVSEDRKSSPFVTSSTLRGSLGKGA